MRPSGPERCSALGGVCSHGVGFTHGFLSFHLSHRLAAVSHFGFHLICSPSPTLHFPLIIFSEKTPRLEPDRQCPRPRIAIRLPPFLKDAGTRERATRDCS